MDNKIENKKPENQNAFPTMEHGYDRTGVPNVSTYEGMSLRDYFAAKAMQSLILKLEIDQENLRYDSELQTIVPVLAYQISDVMLAERQKF